MNTTTLDYFKKNRLESAELDMRDLPAIAWDGYCSCDLRVFKDPLTGEYFIGYDVSNLNGPWMFLDLVDYFKSMIEEVLA